MPMKAQVVVPNVLTLEKAKKLLKIVQRRIADGSTREPGQLVSAMLKAFKTLFAHLKQPLAPEFSIRPEDFRSPEQYTEFLRSLADDLDVMIASTESLTNAAVQTFNLATTKAKSLQNEIRKTTSMSVDIQLLDDNLGANIMVAGDDFSDDSRIDYAFAVDGSRCEVLPAGFGLTIRRSGSANIIDPEVATVEVEAPKHCYEGHYYAPFGQAEPEGDMFHWEELNHKRRPGDPPPKSRRGDKKAVGTGKRGTGEHGHGSREDAAAALRRRAEQGEP